MIGIFSLLLILAVIGVIIGAIWIWKNKNFMKVKALLISLALALVIGFEC